MCLDTAVAVLPGYLKEVRYTGVVAALQRDTGSSDSGALALAATRPRLRCGAPLIRRQVGVAAM